MPSLGSFLPREKPGVFRVDDEGGDALLLLLRSGHGEDDDVIGHRAAGDPRLAPVDDVEIAVAHRPAAHRAGVRAGHRLGERVSADRLAGGDGAHVVLLLRLGAEFQDAVAEQRVVDRHDRAVRRVGFADLLQRQHIRQRVHARPAVLLGHLDAHEAHLAHLLDRAHGELAGFVELGGDGGDLLLGEIAGGLADHLVFCAEGEQVA